MNRTLCFGDTHGAYKALMQVLDRANYDPINDTLICLGDIQDGWSEAHEIIDFLRATSNKIVLLGNHDDCFNWWAKDNFKRLAHPLYAHGGRTTENVYYEKHGLEVAKQDSDFLKQSLQYYIDEQNRLFVHAGWDVTVGVDEQYAEVYTWDRELWSDVSNDVYKPNEFHEIYIGHTPTTRQGSSLPLNFHNVWNLDTGSAFTGVLTLIDIDTKQYWQSDQCSRLYPNERGRN